MMECGHHMDGWPFHTRQISLESNSVHTLQKSLRWDVNDPVADVRGWWIMETLKYPRIHSKYQSSNCQSSTLLCTQKRKRMLLMIKLGSELDETKVKQIWENKEHPWVDTSIMTLSLESALSYTLLSLISVHPHVTAVARKRPRSFCQRCRWQVTAKHAYNLHMWLCMKWHSTWLYGVHRTHQDWLSLAADSCGTSHASAVSTPLWWIFKNAL